MKFTFPHMGNTYISAKVLFDTIGAEYEMPPLCSKKTLEHGIKHSPEFMCLPFKTVLGDVIGGLDKGADVVVFGGGCGQCRFGYYGDLLSEILKSLGYQFSYIHLDFSQMTYKEIVQKVKACTTGIHPARIFFGVALALHTVFFIDRLFQKSNEIRAKELFPGETDAVMKRFRENVLKVKGYKGVKKLADETKKALTRIRTDPQADPIKIAVVGEIFIACEPYTNLEIERKLGEMGVLVHNHLSIGEWIYEHFILNLIPFRKKNQTLAAAKEIINTEDFGGHGIETIGNSILSSKKGYDGIVHLYPFTCMPEIVAQSTFSEIQKRYDIPILSLVIDELSGEAGYLTRLEAFVDMIRIKKESLGPDCSRPILN